MKTRILKGLAAVSLAAMLSIPVASSALARADCRSHPGGLVCGPHAWCQDGDGYWHNAGEQVTVPNGKGGTTTYECGADGYWYRVR